MTKIDDGLYKTMFAIEDRLRGAVDVDMEFRTIVIQAARMIPKSDREEFMGHFRKLFRPLADLESERRSQK